MSGRPLTSAPSFRDMYLYIYWQTGGPPPPPLLLHLLLLSWKPWPGLLVPEKLIQKLLEMVNIYSAPLLGAQAFHAAVNNYTHDSISTKSPETRGRGVLLPNCGDLALCGPL